MNRRRFIKKAGAGLIAASLAGCTSPEPISKAKRKPNFVLIFTDDQGYADVGCFGAEGFKTPNLDRMANQGMQFTDFYVASPVCCPSRAALMTGCYPQRIEMFQNINPPDNVGLNPKEKTIPEVLKKQGYKSGCFGKWHLGHRKPFLPTSQGFDEYWGIPYSHDMKPQSVKIYPQWAHIIEKYPDLPLMHDEKVIERDPDPAKLTTFYTEKAINFIEKNKDEPFFVYLPHSLPHVPLGVSDKFKGKSKKGIYGDVIMEIDWSVGQINKKLKELGLEENTLVVFTSDNGPWMVFGEHAGSADPLRGEKNTTFEGGQRVPCIMKWPAGIPEGKLCDEPVCTIDILPTFAKLANAELPEHKIDGKDISSLMLDKQDSENPYEAIYFYRNRELQAVRSGKWKLHFPHKYFKTKRPGKDGFHGDYEVKSLKKPALYNLEKDPSESDNVADKHPEVVRNLKKLADKMGKQVGDSAMGIKGSEVRKVGALTEKDRQKFLNRTY